MNPKVKDERSKIISKIAEKNHVKFMNYLKGKSLQVLYEQKVDEKSNFYEGLTDNYIRVMAEAAYDIKGKIINTKLNEIKGDIMIGSLEKIW